MELRERLDAVGDVEVTVGNRVLPRRTADLSRLRGKRDYHFGHSPERIVLPFVRHHDYRAPFAADENPSHR